MLTVLRLTDFAIVSSSELRFAAGLNAITGETGAGKSLIMGALSLLVGMRGSNKVVRAGCDSAEVEALFEGVDNPTSVQALQSRGLWQDDGTVVARRVIGRQSHHRCYLNGRLATVSDLREVIGPLIDMCGQHQHARLLDPARQTLILDRFARSLNEVAAHRQAFEAWQSAEKQLQHLESQAAQAEQRRDFLAFCASELDEAAIQPGETAFLADQARKLHGSADLLQTFGEASDRLGGDGGARDQLASIATELGRCSAIDGALAAHGQQADELVALCDELAHDLQRFVDTIETDPQTRAAVDDRMALLHRLIRKYGGTEEALLARKDEIDNELQAVADTDGTLAKLRLRVPELERIARQTAATLSAKRQQKAPELGEKAAEVLRSLAMPQARLDVALVPLDTPGPTGAERVVFRLQSNAGGPSLPLKEIASGGELSRCLLAVERACADPSPSSSAVYDEIDAGLGGETGTLLGQHLAEMARLQQVICITHLPQVAAVAGTHLHVSKAAQSGTTISTVEQVAGTRRVEELARMLGGATEDTAVAHAQRLLTAGP